MGWSSMVSSLSSQCTFALREVSNIETLIVMGFGLATTGISALMDGAGF